MEKFGVCQNWTSEKRDPDCLPECAMLRKKIGTELLAMSKSLGASASWPVVNCQPPAPNRPLWSINHQRRAPAVC